MKKRETSGRAEGITTPRLLLRHWQDEDEEAMDAINADPDVTRFLNRSAPPGFVGRAMAHWDEHGFGLWAVAARAEPGVLIGFAGPSHPEWLPELAHEVELGWRLARSAWGRGYATEAALAARDRAWADLPPAVAHLISVVHPDNERSRRVAGKLGGRVARHVHNPFADREVEVWTVRRPQVPSGATTR